MGLVVTQSFLLRQWLTDRALEEANADYRMLRTDLAIRKYREYLQRYPDRSE